MDPVAARTLLKAKTLPPPQTDWLAWGAIIHRRLQSADESGDACELLAHVLWYHPSDHDDRARLSALRVAEAILALSSSSACLIHSGSPSSVSSRLSRVWLGLRLGLGLGWGLRLGLDVQHRELLQVRPALPSSQPSAETGPGPHRHPHPHP